MFSPKEGNTRFLRTIVKFIPEYVTSYTIRPFPSQKEHWNSKHIIQYQKAFNFISICVGKFLHSRAQWPNGFKARVCGRPLSGNAGSNPAEALMSVSCECCVLSGRGLCDGPIPRPEESYWLCCVIVCHVETSTVRRPWAPSGCCARGGQCVPAIRTRYLTLTCRRQLWTRRRISNDRSSRQVEDQPVVISCAVLFVATNAGDVVSVCRTNGLKAATVEIQNCTKLKWRKPSFQIYNSPVLAHTSSGFFPHRKHKNIARISVIPMIITAHMC